MDLSENVTARFGEVVLETVVEDSFAEVVILAADLVDPVDGDLVVVNQGSQKTSGAVYVVLDSPRKLTLVADPAQGIHGGPIEVTVTLTDASPDDEVELEITSLNDGMPIVALDLDSTGKATTTFVPNGFGYYSVLALVKGDRPRMAGGFIEVLPQFEESGPNPGL